MKRHDEGMTKAPRAVIHKQILEAAGENPESSVEGLAEAVSGANANLVERVLDEYGDPAENSEASKDADETGSSELQQTSVEQSMIETNGQLDNSLVQQDDLTNKQLETMRTIREHPTATQAELAELLGVTSATINTRVNSIDGFDWENRHEFVEQVLEDDRDSTAGESTVPNTRTLDDRLERLEEQFERLESRLAEDRQPSSPISADPELAHKVLHACLSSDRIEEEEELDIVKQFVD